MFAQRRFTSQSLDVVAPVFVTLGVVAFPRDALPLDATVSPVGGRS